MAKSFKTVIKHPMHGELHVYGQISPKDGVKITHYGHGGEIVPAEEAHGSHEGGISEEHQKHIKEHATKMGPGDHSASPAHDIEKCMKSEGGCKAEASDMPKDLNKEPGHSLEKKYEGFEAVKESAKESGARDPGAVAAAIGRKKYGKKAFQEAAAAGKKMHKSEYEPQEVALALADKLTELVEDLEKAEGGSKYSQRKTAVEIKGVHSSGGFTGLEEKGQSQAGRNIERATEKDTPEHMKSFYHGRGKQMHEDKLAELKAMPKPKLTKSAQSGMHTVEYIKKAENPDKEADAELGEKVEKDVEEHMLENKAAEKKEGHKIFKTESKDVPLTNKGRDPWDNGKIEPVVDQSLKDAAGTQKIDEPKITGNFNDECEDGNKKQMENDGKYNKGKKLKKFLDSRKK
jgi:hypothetical protein